MSNVKHTAIAKRVIVTLTVIFLIAVGAIAAIYFIDKNNGAIAEPEANLSSVPDYGACELITTKIIKEARHAEYITSVTEGKRIGQAAPNETDADACYFTFNTVKSTNNSLTVKVYPYTSDNPEGESKESIGTSWSEVAASNPTAFFGRSTNDGKVNYMLRVIPGGKNVMFTLQQPLDHEAFIEPDALDFLVGIAVKANLSAIEANQQNNADAENADTPPPPPSDTVVEQLN